MTKLEQEIYDHLSSFTDDNLHEVYYVKFGLKMDVEVAVKNLEESGLIELQFPFEPVFLDMNKSNDLDNIPAYFLAKVLIQ